MFNESYLGSLLLPTIMKRQLTIVIAYFGILMLTIFVDVPFSNFIVIILTVIFWGFQVFEYYKIANIKFEGDLILRRQSKKVQPLLFFFAFIATRGFYLNDRINFLQLAVFWAIVIFEILIGIITKRLKPIGIIIKDNNLILNDSINTKRNLSQLNSLQLNGLTDEIKMTFVKEKKLYLKRSEYLALDIEDLISICIERSKEQLSISDNLKNVKKKTE